MKKNKRLHLSVLIVLVVLSSILAVSCVTKQPAGQDTSPVQESPNQPAVLPPPLVGEQTPSQNTVEVNELLAKHKDYDSVEFTYNANRLDEVTQVYVKGDKIRKRFKEPSRFNPDLYISDVYIDRSEQSAIGTCELGVKFCTEGRKPQTLSFAQENILTPFDVIGKILYAEKVSTTFFDKRDAIIISTTIDGQDAKVWLDTFYGLPLQVQYLKSDGSVEKSYTFTSLSAGGISDADVTLE